MKIISKDRFVAAALIGACAVGNMSSAHAAAFGGGLVANVINTIRQGVGNIIGYSSDTNYSNLACGGGAAATCQGPPQAGIIGATMSIINGLKTIGQNAGINSCSDVPSSGSKTGKDSAGKSITVTFGTPTHKIPTKWIGGGTTFGKRATFNSTVTIGGTAYPLAVAYEFTCGSSAGYVGISMSVGSNAPGYSRDIAVYNGQVDTGGTNGFQVFMAERDRSDTTNAAIRSSYAIDINYNDSTKLFRIWGILSAGLDFSSGSGANLLIKVNGHGNYSTGKALVFARAVGQTTDNSGKYDSASLSATGANDGGKEADPGQYNMDADLTSDTLRGPPQGSPVVKAFLGCVNFTTATASAPSSADCSSFSLVTPADTTPALDDNGTWSIKWAAQTMPSKVEQLTIPSS